MNPVYETMTRYTFCGWVIRVWREEPVYQEGPDEQVLITLRYEFETDRSLPAIEVRERAIHAVGALPRVAAVEILDPTGNGGLFYPDWK